MAAALAGAVREHPFAPEVVVTGPDDLAPPRVQHPAFYGCYDWHSAVHTHWLLVRLLRTGALGGSGKGDGDDDGEAARARSVLDAHLAPGPLTAEAAHLRAHPGFERPYGRAWLLALAAECASAEAAGVPGAGGWAAALAPAVEVVAAQLLLELAGAPRWPVRTGTHSSSAFSLALVLDAARGAHLSGLPGLPELAAAARERTAAWYLPDRDAPVAYEPSGHDFHSPVLSEAEVVARLLPPADLAVWLGRYWPGLGAGSPSTLLEPVEVGDRSDGQVGHLDGLNLARARSLRRLAAALGGTPDDDRRVGLLQRSADLHLTAGLAGLTEAFAAGEYLSSHWLGTFAVRALQPLDP